MSALIRPASFVRGARNRVRFAFLVTFCTLALAFLIPANTAFAQSASAALASPVSGTVLPGTSATFTWTPGTGVSAYQLYVGTVWNQASNIYNSGVTTSTSATVTGLPNDGVYVYVTLFSEIGGAWQPTHYTFTASGTPVPAALTAPVAGSILSGSSATFSWTAGSGVTNYMLYVGTVWSQGSDVFNSGAMSGTSVTVNNLPTDGVTVYVTVLSQINGVWQPAHYSFTASGKPVPASMISPSAGSVLSGSSTTFTWNPGAGPTEYYLFLGTTGAGSSNLLNSGGIAGTSFTATGLPSNSATVYATLFSEINGAWQAAHYTYTAAPAVPALSAISCSSASITGSGSNACTVTLSSAASTGVSVNLASSTSAVAIPSAVMVAAGASSASFMATVSPVTTAQSATLTASSGSVTKSFSLQVNASTSSLNLSAASIGFGAVTVNTPTTQALTLTSTGNAALTINAASLSGAGFSLSAATFPMTLNPGQSATFEIEFDPTAAGTASGQLTISSNSTSAATVVVSLSGTGNAPSYSVDLNWDEPTDSTGTIAGFNVYRAVSGSTTYQKVNSSVQSSTSFVDATVQAGVTYNYYVQTVDTTGASSAPSATVALAIP